MEHESKNSQFSPWSVLVGTVVLLVAAAAAKHVHYLLFHTMVELLSVTVSFSIFTLTWASLKHLKNSYLIILGAAYGTTGIVDVLHTLTFQGMNLFPAVTTNHPTQFWLTARFIESVALIAAPLFLRHTANFRLASWAFATLGAAGVIPIWLGILPATFVNGVGLTLFKIGSEYAIIVMLLVGLALLWRNRHEFSRDVFRLLSVSVIMAVATEICFTQYVNFYDFSNELGHYFRLVSVVLTYLAIVVTGVQRPAEILFRQVVKNEAELTVINTRLAQSENRLNQAQSLASIGSWHLDMASGKLMCSDEAYRILGLAIDTPVTLAMLGANIHPDDCAALAAHDAVSNTLDDVEYRIVADGKIKWVRRCIEHQLSPDKRPLIDLGTVQDITERKFAEQRLHEAALHDSLTGLPNRAFVFEFCGHLLAAAQRNHGRGALLFIDLDRFKPINDVHGHGVGDRVLCEVSKRLLECTRREDLVGRLGGDEFVLVLPYLAADRNRAAVVAQHVIDSIKRPFQIDALELSISPSIGISCFPEHAYEVSALIHAADLAMYQAKQSGRGNYQMYTPELDQRAEQVHSVELRLKNALKQNGLALHYQPVINLASGKVTGAEALLRLTDKYDEPISPASFIPIAEATGLIGVLGEWVAAEACRQQVAWLGLGLKVTIAINVSPLQFRQPAFAKKLERIIAETGIDPAYLEIEVTESTVMESVEDAVDILSRIKSLGVKIALDDFGTGYSSLSILSSLPLDKLKVDQSFVRRIERDPASRAVTEAIIALGHSLSLEVVGEGIESESVLRYLQERGCNQVQGFWFSQPLPPLEFARWYFERSSKSQVTAAV